MQRAEDSHKIPHWIFSLFGLLVFGAVVVALKDLITLVAVSYALAYLADKCLTFLERYKIPRWAGFVILCLAIITLVLIFVIVLLPPLWTQGMELVERLPRIVENYSVKAQGMLESFSPGATQKYFSQKALLSYVDPALLQNLFHKFITAILTGYNLVLTILNVVLLPIITFYLAVDFRHVHRAFLRLIDADKRSTVVSLSRKINNSISAYLQGQTLVALVLAVMYCVGFAIVGVPLWLAVGILTGLLNIVPYFGTIIGILLSFGLLLADGTTGNAYWGLVAVFVLAQLLEGNLITPKVVGDRVGLSPLVVLLAILAFGQLLGLLGIIIAVPATAALKVIAHYILQQRKEVSDA